MGKVQEKMICDLKTKGMSDCTVRSYLQGVMKLIKFCRKAPEQISIAEIQKFHLHLVETEKLSGRSVNVYMAGVKFLYFVTLARNWDPRVIPHTKVKRLVPLILSPDQIAETDCSSEGSRALFVFSQYTLIDACII